MAYLSAKEAYEEVLKNTPEGRKQVLSIEDQDLFGRILAEDVVADRDIPPFHRAAVDGYAIRIEEMQAGESFEILGTLRAGSGEIFETKKGGALFIMTGAPVPEDYNAIIKVEEASVDGDRVSFDREPPSLWSNIARRGEDAPAGSVVVKAGTRIDTSSLPILAAVGKTELLVYAKPVVTLITSGDEVVPAGTSPLDHQIRDSSSYSIGNLLRLNGAGEIRKRRVEDNPDLLLGAIQEGLKSDFLLITGGVSMGVTDVIPELLEKAGVKKVFHRIKVKPGKPLYFGKTDGGTLVFGLPGNPVSSQVGLKMFVEPAIRRWSGKVPRRPLVLPLAEEKKKKHDLEEFTQVRIVEKDGASALLPFKHHGSGDFVNLSGADGLMVHPADETLIPGGKMVEFYPWISL